MLFPHQSCLHYSVPCKPIQPDLWMDLEFTAGDVARSVQGRPPAVMAADVSPLLDPNGRPVVADWFVEPSTRLFLALATENPWRGKGYEKTREILETRKINGMAKKIPGQTPKGLVGDLFQQIKPLAKPFFLRFENLRGESSCCFWSTDERYRAYRDHRQKVKDALRVDPKGMVYPLVHPDIVVESSDTPGQPKRRWFRMFCLFFVLDRLTAHYNCVGGVAVDERHARDPKPRLSFAPIAHP